MSLSELAQKREVQPQQIIKWKKDFLESASVVFEKGKKDLRSEAKQEKDRLLKANGELKVENNFLKNALR